jgi:hypothetical protein
MFVYSLIKKQSQCADTIGSVDIFGYADH